MAEVDTSSYKLPQTNFLDTAAKFQSLAQGATNLQRSNIALSQDKINFVTNQFKNAADELSILSNDPNTTPTEVLKILNNRLDLINADPKVRQQLNSQFSNLPNEPLGKDGSTNPQLARGLDLIKRRVQDVNSRFQSLYGTPSNLDDGQYFYPGRTYERGGFEQVGEGIPKKLPTGTELKDTRQFINGQPNPKYGSPYMVEPSGPAPRLPNSRLPIAPQDNINLTGPGKTITGVEVIDKPNANQVVQNRFPSGVTSGMTPLFEEGKKVYSEDQALATQKLTAVKPAIAAANLMKDLRSGPGTETWNKAVAFMKANNIIPTTANDPTAIYQEVNKYLNQYVQGGGTRSDADLAQRELSNPNVTQQISPALIKLTRNTIALDRIQAARAGSFESNDFSKYGNYRSNFPASVDERAFSIDLLEQSERQKLLGEMLKKKNTKEGQKFFKSLEIAKRTGVLQ